MSSESAILAYYAARANAYEKMYARPEHQSELRDLHRLVPAYLTGAHVLEVACGTGYWTRLIAPRSATITGVDHSPEVLAIARAQQPASTPAAFVFGDAFSLEPIAGAFDAAFVGFWWSRMLRQDIHRFLLGLHRRLPPDSLVLILDNRFVDGTDAAIARIDAQGNTYQRRLPEREPEDDALRNFPSPSEVNAAIVAAGGRSIAIRELQHFWYAAYRIARVDGAIRTAE